MSELMAALANQVLTDRVLEVLHPSAQPAAGAQVAFNFPGDRIYRLRGVVVKLVTSAVVGNRQLAITLDDQASVVAAAASQILVPASTTATIAFAKEAPSTATSLAGGFATAGLPELIFPGGYVLRTLSSAFDVADQITLVSVWAETLLVQPFGVHEQQGVWRLEQQAAGSPSIGGM